MTTWTTNLEIPHLDQNVAQPEIPENEAKDIIDAALGGILTKNLGDGVNYTLDDTALAYPQDVHYGTIKITGGGALGNIIYVPTTIKQHYIVHNTTTGVVTLSQNAVTQNVPASSIYNLYCDGTAVYRIT